MLFRLVILSQRPFTKGDSPISLHRVPIARDEMRERSESVWPSKTRWRPELRTVSHKQACELGARLPLSYRASSIGWNFKMPLTSPMRAFLMRFTHLLRFAFWRGQHIPGMSTRMTAPGTSRGAFTVGRSVAQ